MKKILKHRVTARVLAFLLAAFIRLAWWTSRVTRDAHEEALPYLRGEENCILAFWHGRMMLMPLFKPPGRKVFVMISRHGDGELITQAIRYFDLDTVRGSTSKGGAKAASEGLAVLAGQDNICITPDGPRGPRHVAAPGIVQIARLSGKKILPVSFASTRHKTFRSWDKFHLALPFGHVAFTAGSPIAVPPDAGEAELADALRRVERDLVALGAKAEAMLGIAPC